MFSRPKEIGGRDVRDVRDLGTRISGVSLLRVRRFGFVRFSRGVNIDTSLFGGEKFSVFGPFSIFPSILVLDDSKASHRLSANTRQLIRQLIEEIRQSSPNIYEQSDGLRPWLS